MSILDELDELHNLQDIEKEASLASLASSVKGFFRGSKGASGSVIHTPRPTVPKLTDLTDTGKATATSRSRSVLDPNMRVVSRAERRAAQGNIIDGSARPVSSAPSAGRSASEESVIYGRGPTVAKVNHSTSAPTSAAKPSTAEPHIYSDTGKATATSGSRRVLDPNMRVVSRAERRAAQSNIIDGTSRPVNQAPSAGRSTSEESVIYGSGPTVAKVNHRAPEPAAAQASSTARASTTAADSHIASDTISTTRAGQSAGQSAGQNYGSTGVNAGPGFSGKVAPQGPVNPNLKTSFTQTPAGVASTTTASTAARSQEPTSNLFGKIKDIMTKERHIFPQRASTPTAPTPQRSFPKGETLESRRAWVEKNNPSRATVGEEMPRPGEAPKAKENTEADTPTKWYKDKKIMKGVGIGAVGAGAVGLGAHMLSQKGQSQDSGTAQGYY